MTWWRRDPSLWARTPIHHYARYAARDLRDPEAILRTRCFSKTHPRSAQHKDDQDSRPSGLSDLEWLQLQRYRRWRRRIEENPYRALFGASEDMLSGKGLKDWDWVHKAFPKWMVKDMNFGVWGKERDTNGWWRRVNDHMFWVTDAPVVSSDGKGNKSTHPAGPRASDETINTAYPKKVDIDRGNASQTQAPEPSSSSLRSVKSERDLWNCGVESPSDPRRPREQPTSTPVDQTPKVRAEEVNQTKGSSRTIETPQEPNQQIITAKGSSKEAAAREACLIDEFLAARPQTRLIPTEEEKSNDWRQTVLDRRASADPVSRPRRKTDMPIVDVTSRSSTAAKSVETPHTPRRSTSQILAQLPQDDIDFLSADDIRASMGTKNGHPRQDSDSRQNLDKGFAALEKEDLQLDPIIQSKILNDQYVRRVERELTQAHEQKVSPQESLPIKPAGSTVGQVAKAQQDEIATSETPQQVSVLETSLDFMSKWLHSGGSLLANQIWTDPVKLPVEQSQEKHSLPNDRFLKGIIRGTQKGRRALWQVKMELEHEVPACKPLVERLTNNERALMKAAAMLGETRLGTKDPSATTETEIRERVRSLRQALLDTEKEFEKACATINDMKIPTDLTERFKSQVRTGADILQKNLKLTRMMIFGLQARLEGATTIQTDVRIKDLIDRLLALQDTQFALAKLVSKVMQVYGIREKAQENTRITSLAEDSHRLLQDDVENGKWPTIDEDSEAKRLRDTAAASLLENEIHVQKVAMRGRSDDGYRLSAATKKRQPFDDPNPLAHSLFMPFASQLDGSSDKVKGQNVEAKEDARKVKADQELVREVKRSYEDVYGPITPEHRQIPTEQVASSFDAAKSQESQDAPRKNVEEMPFERLCTPPKEERPSVQLLKEDGVSPSVSTINTSIDVSTKTHESDPQNNTRVETGSSQDQNAAAQPEQPPVVSAVSNPVSTEVNKPLDSTSQKIAEPEGAFSPKHLPSTLQREYRVLTYDTQTDEILITTSYTPWRETSSSSAAPVPLHEALATLSNPSRYLPHLPQTGFDILVAKPDQLVLGSSHPGAPQTPVQTVRAPASGDAELSDEAWRGINPIDGTTRLSPTGYVGDGLELEREFEERRKAAGEYSGRFMGGQGARGWRRAKKEKNTGKVGFGGVMKTAIIAGAWCYVAGVIAEMAR